MLRRLVSYPISSEPDWKIALVFALALRVLFSAIAAAMSFLLHPDPFLIRSNALTDHLSAPGGLHYALIGVWERFDTLWFLHIAQHGYDKPMAVIFYPLYPAAIRGVSFLLPATIAALAVSTAAAFFFFWGMLRLAGHEISGTGRVRVLALISVWPTSFILYAGYAEALTAALIVWAVIFARANRWWPAAFCGFLAGLGRPSGVLVAIPLFVLAGRSRRTESFAVVLAPLGTLGYWAWLRWSGRPSVTEAYGTYQHTPLAAPWKGLGLALSAIAQGDTLVAIKLGLILVALAFSLRREVRLEDKLFAAAAILQMFMFTGRPIIGAARYVLMVYPAFLGWAAYAERKWNRVQFGFYAAALALLNVIWMAAFMDWSLVL